MIFGTTFSHPYIRDHFKLSVRKAFTELLNLKLSLVRLSCYWSEVEKEPGEYDFGEIAELLKMAQKAEQKIVLIIGMKAVRWPEFYVPKWTNYEEVIKNPSQLLTYIEQALLLANKFSCVKYLQIENEPLDKSGPNKLTVPLRVLTKEIQLARELSSLPIVLTMWGNVSLKDSRLRVLDKLGDIIGLDLYYQIPDGKGGYWGPKDSIETLQKQIIKVNKPVWITELQTNPWKGEENLTSLEVFENNFSQARHLPVEAILFWGFEYWYYLKSKKDSIIWNYIHDLKTKLFFNN